MRTDKNIMKNNYIVRMNHGERFNSTALHVFENAEIKNGCVRTTYLPFLFSVATSFYLSLKPNSNGMHSRRERCVILFLFIFNCETEVWCASHHRNISRKKIRCSVAVAAAVWLVEFVFDVWTLGARSSFSMHFKIIAFVSVFVFFIFDWARKRAFNRRLNTILFTRSFHFS